MDSQKLKGILIIALAGFFAIYLGVAAATAQTEALAWVAGIAGLVFLLSMGRNIWTLIPIFAVLGGTLPMVPGYPTPWYAVTPVVTALLAARFMMRSKNFTYQFTWLDVLVGVQILTLLQAYLRNPTGLAIFGSTGMIGGRPYMDYGMAIFVYFLLATVKTELPIVKKVILFMVILSVADQAMKGATGFSGGLSRIVGKVYSNVDYAANEAGSSYTFDISTTRFTSLADLGVVITQALFAFNRPLECLLPWRPLRFLALGFGLAATLLSGFRSMLIKAGCFFIIGTVVRRKPQDFMVAGAAAIMLLAGILAVGPRNLPDAAQRTLSFLPIDVDDSVRAAAQGSSEWRHEMWRLVLTTDRYIQNKFLGDGFGFSAAEQEAQQQDTLGFRKYSGDSIDAFIAKGSYHGWHVEAIRFTGALGLVVGVVIFCGFFRCALTLVNHHRGTALHPYMIFLAMPFLVEPYYSLFVFGSYKGSFISYFAMSGMLRLVYGLYLAEIRQPAVVTQLQTPEPQQRLPVLQGRRPAFAKRA
jgi:hypothetical protein